ncbi:MAG: hypothetical protein P1U40_12320 [Coxiellaceae bacterium]|nr:hypothetical protein [Coxiellaceae bacterium]
MSRNFSHAPLIQAASKLSNVECDEVNPLHHAISAIRIALAEDDIDYDELLHLSRNIIKLIPASLKSPTRDSAVELLRQHENNIKAATTIAQPRLFTEGKAYQAASKLLKYCRLHVNPLYAPNAAKLRIITTTPGADRTEITQQTKDLLSNILDTLGIATPKNTSDIPACEAYLLSTDTSNKPLLLNALRWLQSTLPAPGSHAAPSATPKHA